MIENAQSIESAVAVQYRLIEWSAADRTEKCGADSRLWPGTARQSSSGVDSKFKLSRVEIVLLVIL
jgi:hypothetical protein